MSSQSLLSVEPSGRANAARIPLGTLPVTTKRPSVYVVKSDGPAKLALSSLVRAEGFSPCTFDDGAAFLAACERLPPGCVITGYHTGGMDALEFLGRLGAKPVFFPTIIVANTGEVTQAVEAMKAGAATILERPYADDLLLGAVRSALALKVPEEARNAHRLAIASLTPREHDVLCQLLGGNTNKVSARHLGISPRTVEIYRASLMKKTGVGSVPELVRLAVDAHVKC
jgi:two-component system response regulator FixJ